VSRIEAFPLLLASASPRRAQLLRGVGVAVEVRPVDVDERSTPDEAAGSYLERIVELKRAAARAIAGSHPGVLVADTIVVLDERVVGKPRDDNDSVAILRGLSGTRHEVRTRFALDRLDPEGRVLDSRVATVTTAVFVRALDPAWIDRYVRTGEGRDKAGSYAIQGIFGAAVSRIEGSYSNVVGLPLCEVIEALEQLGLLNDGPMSAQA
jgi:septum formation protein